MHSQQATTEAQDWDSPSPSKEIVSSIPTGAATQHSEVTPTAPLNPRRSTHELGSIPQPVLSPPALAPGPKLEGSTDSPVKDSDLLSDEIIRSLSPVKPASSTAEDAEEPTAAYHAAAGPTRESSYLGDVYGDYWEASAEDKADPGVLAVPRASEPEKTAQEPLPAPAYEAPKEVVATPGLSIPSKSSNVQAEKVPDPGPVATPSPGELRTRFSWEAALDSPTPPGLSTALFVEQKSPGSGVENVAAFKANVDTPEPKPLQLSGDVAGVKSTEDLRAESAPEVNPEVHEAVHQPIMLAPAPTLEGPRDSPSPLSITTDRTKRLSMAEEKILVNETTTPVSPPPPPLDQHPIFANTQQPREAELPSTPTAQNIVSFRSIMEMPSPAERIKHYSDTLRG
ncbi:hypothetical protein N0V88_003458 [Collariella sp. IMI 366227]|nr:hypothetical protein N0V88_003458 [Collariella sp. IMI 366227]